MSESPFPSYYKNSQFYDTQPFCFFMEKYLLAVDFRWHNQDCVSIAAEFFEEFNTKVLLSIYISIPPPIFA